MSPADPIARQHAWRRGSAWLRYGFAAVLALCAVLTGLDGAVAGWAKVAEVLMGVGLFCVVRFGPRDRDEQLPFGWRLGAVAGAILVLWMGLTLIHPAHFLLLFLLYPLIFIKLTIRPAIVTACLLSVETALMDFRRAHQSLAEQAPGLLVVLLGGAVGSLFAVWIHGIIEQSRQRHQLIEELERTRAELGVAEREAGVLQERERLATEIHDTLAQGFTSIVMLSQAAEAGLPGDTPEAVRRQLELVARTARENLDEARRLIAGRASDALVGRSLPAALDRLARRLSEETGVEATCQVTGETHPLPPSTEVAVLRAAQESLANVRKHADAHVVTMTLTYDRNGVVLDVQDDGVGFDPDASSDGFGLAGMRQRLERLGGRVDIGSRPGLGTTIKVALA